MNIHVSKPVGDKKNYSTTDGAAQSFDIVACPECSMTAAMREWDQLESTDGPVGHVRITCVNKHWFLMPADMFNEHL